MSNDEPFSFPRKTQKKTTGRVGIHRGRGRRRIPSMPLIRVASNQDESALNPKTSSLAEAVTFIADVAKTTAAQHGFVCIVEFAGGSESTYIHTRRPSDRLEGTTCWYGVRISAHLAKYACSSDYEQLLLSKTPEQAELNIAAGKMRALVLGGGRPVAEPHLVRNEIWRAQVDAACGKRSSTRHDGEVLTWVWKGSDEGWETEMPTDVDVNHLRPTWIPRVELDTATTAAIRHRVNRREAWTASQRNHDD